MWWLNVKGRNRACSLPVWYSVLQLLSHTAHFLNICPVQSIKSLRRENLVLGRAVLVWDCLVLWFGFGFCSRIAHVICKASPTELSYTNVPKASQLGFQCFQTLKEAKALVKKIWKQQSMSGKNLKCKSSFSLIFPPFFFPQGCFTLSHKKRVSTMALF